MCGRGEEWVRALRDWRGGVLLWNEGVRALELVPPLTTRLPFPTILPPTHSASASSSAPRTATSSPRRATSCRCTTRGPSTRTGASSTRAWTATSPLSSLWAKARYVLFVFILHSANIRLFYSLFL